jgi:hypothetical protein
MELLIAKLASINFEALAVIISGIFGIYKVWKSSEKKSKWQFVLEHVPACYILAECHTAVAIAHPVAGPSALGEARFGMPNTTNRRPPVACRSRDYPPRFYLLSPSETEFKKKGEKEGRGGGDSVGCVILLTRDIYFWA